MSTKFVLNETSYFGNGARSELAGEIQKRGFKKVHKNPSADPLYRPFKSLFTKETIISLYAYISFNLLIIPNNSFIYNFW